MLSENETQTMQMGKKLAGALHAGDFVALRGELGAGKTAFVRGMAESLGGARVSSPTFTIVHEYATTPPLFHFDAYRLGGAGELYDMGFEDYFRRGGIIVMEWPECVEDAVPEKRVDVCIKITGENAREITLEDRR